MDKTNHSIPGLLIRLAVLLALLAAVAPAPYVRAAPTTYYVSSSAGNDGNNGLSESTPFKTIAKVNSLALQPGDRVLFKCGDTWRAEPLIIKWAGTADAPIAFSSYPAGCVNKPILSGSLPITGWTVHSGNIYWASVPEGTFPLGINQLFRNGQRLRLGRWPNLDAPNGGYSFVGCAHRRQQPDHR